MIGRAPSQIGPFSWATLKAFQVMCLSVGVPHILILFSKMFNLLHLEVLSYFHAPSGVKSMLYSEKPGKDNPNRWHRYWFLPKDAFSDEIPCQFSVDYRALNPKESEETTIQFNKLVMGFPTSLPLKTFCDPDVVIKACSSSYRLHISSKKLFLFKKEKALVPSTVNYKAIVSGKSLINKVLGQKGSSIASQEPRAKEPSPAVASPLLETPWLVS
ncbi:hypothetical protein LIER_25789 [Lithospermum erythrorhizon]|uniref:Uncharacterized protein n=1 Tax=Lithospermum erythrorhizon TaxID=34254 RepID=A0AAV3R6A2_LITER